MKNYIPVVFNDQNKDINERFEDLHEEFCCKVTAHLERLSALAPQIKQLHLDKWRVIRLRNRNESNYTVVSNLPSKFRYCFNRSTTNKNDLVQLLARANIAIIDPANTVNNEQLLLLVNDIQNRYNELLKGYLGSLLIVGAWITTLVLINATSPAFPVVLLIGIGAFMVNGGYQLMKAEYKQESNILKNDIKRTKTDANNFSFFKIEYDLEVEKTNSESQIAQKQIASQQLLC